MNIRDIHIIEQEIHSEGGRRLDTPVTRVAACATLKNPLAGKVGVDDLSEIVSGMPDKIWRGRIYAAESIRDEVRSFCEDWLHDNPCDEGAPSERPNR